MTGNKVNFYRKRAKALCIAALTPSLIVASGGVSSRINNLETDNNNDNNAGRSNNTSFAITTTNDRNSTIDSRHRRRRRLLINHNRNDMKRFDSSSTQDGDAPIEAINDAIRSLDNNNVRQHRQLLSDNCTLNDIGFYGDPVGQTYEIGYLYQTIVTAGTSSVEITSAIAPALNLAITSGTIPYLFPACSTRRVRHLRQQQRRLHHIRRNLQQPTDPVINAISALPDDVFVMSGCK